MKLRGRPRTPGELFGGIPEGAPRYPAFVHENEQHTQGWWLHGTTLHDAYRLWKRRPKRRIRWVDGARNNRGGAFTSLDGLYLFPEGTDTADEYAREASAAMGHPLVYEPHWQQPTAITRHMAPEREHRPLLGWPTVLHLHLGPRLQIALDEDSIWDIEFNYSLGVEGGRLDREMQEQGEPFVGFPDRNELRRFKRLLASCKARKVADARCRRRIDRWTKDYAHLVTRDGHGGFKIRVLPPFHFEPVGWELDDDGIVRLYGELVR
jgi:hypothetical protein